MKKINLAVAAALALGASAAQAGITIPAGDWTVDIGGNANAYYTHVKTTGAQSTNTIGTGLLPSALGIGAKTRQNDLDIAFQFTFFTGASAGGTGATGVNQALAGNTLNIRQAYLTFGDKSWGTIKAGRDLGIFESDAILSDMTLLGVGSNAGAGGSSTLGRIGSGYMYADWFGQIAYASPNWNGFSFAAAIVEPISNGVDTSSHDMGYQGKVNYEWAGDFAGKVWLGGTHQKHKAVGAAAGYSSKGYDLGGKVSFAGAELVGSYYNGNGLSGQRYGAAATGANLNGAVFNGALYAAGQDTDDDGGYVQLTYKIPGIGTKLGASWGENNSTSADGLTDTTTKSWIVGAYHPLTKSLNLVAEYSDAKNEYTGRADTKVKTTSLGAILFF